MRVAVDIGPLHGRRTGIGSAVEHTVRALEARPDVELTPYLVSFRAHPADGEVRLPLPAMVALRLWSSGDRPRADRWLRGVDLVHGTNYTVPPTSIPSVVSVYDCWFLDNDHLASPDVRRSGRVLRRAVDRGAWVHTSSEATAERVRDLLDTDRVVSVHLGPLPVDPAPSSTPALCRALEGRSFVLAIGTSERRKRHPWLVSLADRLPEGHDLVVAGAPGDDAAALAESVAALPDRVAGRVHLLGAVDAEAKAWLLGAASVLAYPSMDEGFGFPVLEAQAVGVPVVASRVGSIPEVAGEGALLVDRDDSEGFAVALERVLTDGSLRSTLVASGSANLSRFSWESTAEGLVALYERALGGGS